MRRSPLAGRRILVTRPAERAGRLAELIREAGGEPVLFPAIRIGDVANPGPLLALIDRLEQFDLAIFVSPSAVQKAFSLIQARRAGKPWPARVRVAALGSGSRRELEQRGVTGVIAPASGADSEALLAVPQLAGVAGWRVAIFRGEGGRELLGETLAARGARVEYAECYRRANPRADAAPLLDAWAREALDAVTVTSVEGLANLSEMLGEAGRGPLKNTPLFVPHARVAEQAARLGVQEAIVAGPGDAEMVARLVAYFRAAS
jgi:uroporphyrinogen-III synthase